MARVERLDQYIADLQEKVEIAMRHPAAQKVQKLVQKLNEAMRVNEEMLASEEEIPVLTEPKERKPRRKKEEMNGGMKITTIPAADFDPTLEERSE